MPAAATNVTAQRAMLTPQRSWPRSVGHAPARAARYRRGPGVGMGHAIRWQEAAQGRRAGYISPDLMVAEGLVASNGGAYPGHHRHQHEAAGGPELGIPLVVSVAAAAASTSDTPSLSTPRLPRQLRRSCDHPDALSRQLAPQQQRRHVASSQPCCAGCVPANGTIGPGGVGHASTAAKRMQRTLLSNKAPRRPALICSQPPPCAKRIFILPLGWAV